MKVRIAVTPPAVALEPEHFPAYLAACEDLGFDTLWLSDIPLGSSGDPMISLTYAAGATKKLKLGANIVPLGRNPLWLAKQLAQLDRVSGGRLLISLVPGLGSLAERAALGHGARGANRGAAVDHTMALLRQWWAGDAVSDRYGEFSYDAVALEPRPHQQPLEIWLGGKGPQALSRVAHMADGWLTSLMTPAEAGAGRLAIENEARALDRAIDAEHFGISIPASRGALDSVMVDALAKRREDGNLEHILGVGKNRLRDLIAAHIDVGLSKFVVRLVEPNDEAPAPGQAWRDQLEWLADSVLALQT